MNDISKAALERAFKHYEKVARNDIDMFLVYHVRNYYEDEIATCFGPETRKEVERRFVKRNPICASEDDPLALDPHYYGTEIDDRIEKVTQRVLANRKRENPLLVSVDDVRELIAEKDKPAGPVQLRMAL